MNIDNLIASLASGTPRWVFPPVLRAALEPFAVALCLHRVGEVRRPTDGQPALTISPRSLDALIELLLPALNAGPTGPRLSVTFDDGYADAASYVESRAQRYPEVEWIFFVCPQKTESGVGFRWDLVEQGSARPELLHDAPDVRLENGREELRRLSEDPRFQLASVATCRALQALPNVSLGNHTNHHFKQTSLSEAQVREEYEQSAADFARLFGPAQHFAFPFGTPEYEFNAFHVAELRAHGSSTIWSTERRPYGLSERVPGAVLPRFPVNGTWSPRQLVAWIIGRAALYRARGSRFDYSLHQR